MDIVWIILDSLSFRETSFADDGPDTTPQTLEVSRESGVVFTEAYSPGILSPSAHGSIFTGKLPSETGMHEAYPYLSENNYTITQELNKTHESLLVSSNSFLTNGIHRDFQHLNDLISQHYMIFEDAADPRNYSAENDTSGYQEYLDYLNYCLTDDRPLKSVINGLNLALKRRVENERSTNTKGRYDDYIHQYANTINHHVLDFLDEYDRDVFIATNYMDVHPPFDASDEALERFAPEYAKDELPIGVRGKDILKSIREGDGEIERKAHQLLQACIWDLDRKIGPLVEKLVERDVFVVLTSDHGTWFRSNYPFEDNGIHVPLVLFPPEGTPETIDKTVNLRQLPKTTASLVDEADSSRFDGRSLFDVTADQTSITEFIHDADYNMAERGNPVNPHGAESNQHDICMIRGDSRVDYYDGEFKNVRGNEDDVSELRGRIEDLLGVDLYQDEDEIEYDEQTLQRLKDFGYL